MKKIVKDLDKFVEYTGAWKQVLEVSFWPSQFAIIVYSNCVKELVVHQERNFKYVRFLWFEVNYKIGGKTAEKSKMDSGHSWD